MTVVFDPGRHCGAKSKRCTNDPPTCVHADGIHACRLAKGAGTDHQGAGHCKWHLGNSENGTKSAQKEQAQQALTKLGIPLGNGDPFVLLEKAVRYAEGYLEATGTLLVDVVEKRNLVVSLEAAAGIHVRAIRQAATTGNQAVEANVADRMATIDERKVELLQLAIQSALDRMGAEPDWNQRFMTTLGEELVKITAPSALVAAGN